MGRASALGSIGFACVCTALVFVAWTMRFDESRIPLVTAPMAPRVRAVHGLELDASAALPAWTARTAVPLVGGPGVGLGGLWERLDAEGVSVSIGPATLAAARGEATLERLDLVAVELRRADGSRVLVSARASVERGIVDFPGLVVFDGERESRHRLRTTLAELEELARR